MRKVTNALHLAAGDELKSDFNFIEFTNGMAYCTDKHVAVIVPVTELFNCDQAEADQLNGKSMHIEVWKSMVYNKKCILKDGVVYFSINPKRHPSYAVLFADRAQIIAAKIEAIWPQGKDEKAVSQIGLNWNMFLRAQKATGVGASRMTFFGSTKSVLVDCSQGKSAAKALVMPVMIFNEQ